MSDLSVTEAAALAGVSEKTLRKRIACGEVQAKRETLAGGGWAWRVAADSIETPERLEAKRLEDSNRVTENFCKGFFLCRFLNIFARCAIITRSVCRKLPATARSKPC